MAQLAGLVSLLRGIDMSPLQNARDTSLRRGGLIEQNRAAQAAEALQSRSLDITQAGQEAGIALDRDRLNLGRDELAFREKDAAEQRGLMRELERMRQEGAVDLQNLVGAQEIANINLKGQVDKSLEEDRAAFQEARDRLLVTLNGDALEEELALRAADEERQYKLNKQRGIDPGADSQLNREIKGIEKAMLMKQQEYENARINGEMASMADQMRHAKEMRRLSNEKTTLEIKQIRRQLEETDPDNPVVKELRESEKRIVAANIRKAEAEAEQEEQNVALGGKVLEKEGITKTDDGYKQTKPAEKETGAGGTEIDKTISRLSDKVERLGSTPVYGVTGYDSALKAAEQLKDLQGLEEGDEEYDQLRADLKRAIELGEKAGNSKVSKYPFVRTTRIIPAKGTLTPDEVTEYEELLDRLYDAGVPVGYAD